MAKTEVKLVLLDRDGVVNVSPPKGDYIKSPDDLHLIAGVAEAIRELNKKNIKVAIVTNQQGVGKGIYSVAALGAIHEKLRAELKEEKAHIDAIFYCPHLSSDKCSCRKPCPGMLLDLMKKFGAKPEETVMVGDYESDMQAGKAAGVRNIYIPSSTDTPEQIDYINKAYHAKKADSLLSAVKHNI